jgi:hypothetical protein
MLESRGGKKALFVCVLLEASFLVLVSKDIVLLLKLPPTSTLSRHCRLLVTQKPNQYILLTPFIQGCEKKGRPILPKNLGAKAKTSLPPSGLPPSI